MIMVPTQRLSVANNAMTMDMRTMSTAHIVTTITIMTMKDTSTTLRPGVMRMDRSRPNWPAPAAGAAACPR